MTSPATEPDSEREAIMMEAAPPKLRIEPAPNTPQSLTASGRVTIRWGPKAHQVVPRAIAALASDPDIYQRDGKLVRVVRVSEIDPEAHIKDENGNVIKAGVRPVGAPIIRDVPDALLLTSLSRVARWLKFDQRGKSWVECLPPKAVIDAVAASGDYPGVRVLNGVVDGPALRPDGSILKSPGYDAATGLLYAPSCTYPLIPEQPTLEQARAALLDLHEVWSEFEWSDPGHAYIAVALALSLLARHAIAGPVPAHAFDSSTRGSGKGYTVQCAAIIGTGACAPELCWPTKEHPGTHRADDAEAGKIYGAIARAAAAVCFWDEVTTPISGGPHQHAVTTYPRGKFRRLGKSEAPDLLWFCVLAMAGNGLSVALDMARRTLMARMEPSVERPELRTGYKHHPLLPWVASERPRLVVAALTLLRAHALAGRPDVGCGRTDNFAAWSTVVASAIAWAGGPDVTSYFAGSDPDGGDSDLDRLVALLAGVRKLATPTITARGLVGVLYTSERLRAEQGREHDEPPDEHDPTREAIDSILGRRPGQPPDAHALGRYLATIRGRVAGGMKLVKSAKGSPAKWRVDDA